MHTFDTSGYVEHPFCVPLLISWHWWARLWNINQKGRDPPYHAGQTTQIHRNHLEKWIPECNSRQCYYSPAYLSFAVYIEDLQNIIRGPPLMEVVHNYKYYKSQIVTFIDLYVLLLLCLEGINWTTCSKRLTRTAQKWTHTQKVIVAVTTAINCNGIGCVHSTKLACSASHTQVCTRHSAHWLCHHSLLIDTHQHGSKA